MDMNEEMQNEAVDVAVKVMQSFPSAPMKVA